MKVGIVLPVFQADDTAAMRMVDVAEASNIDGVFAPDYRISPSGGPAQSVLEILQSTASRTKRLQLGSLVARIGARSSDELTEGFAAVNAISDNRFIAGLGIGDARAKHEDELLGIPWIPRAERLTMLCEQTQALKRFGVEVWLGGKSSEVRSMASSEQVALNLWDATADEVSAVTSPVTWAGRVEPVEQAIAAQLGELEAAGATWAVFLLVGSGSEPERAVQTLVTARDIASL